MQTPTLNVAARFWALRRHLAALPTDIDALSELETVKADLKSRGWKFDERVRVSFTRGEKHYVTLPYSEACMHMRCAGKTALVEWKRNGNCQIYSYDGRPFSTSVTAGEAGLMQQEDPELRLAHLNREAPLL